MRTLLMLLTLALLSGCLATENADFRAAESPSGYGSSPGQIERGNSTVERTQTSTETVPAP